MKNITTEADFKYFVSECKYWVEYFGLKSWDWNFQHSNENPKSGLAWVTWNHDGRNATITLERKWVWADGAPYMITRKELSRSAFHEICEVILAKVTTMLRGYFSTDFVAEVDHEIIRTLENTVWKREYDRRHK